MLVTDIYNQYTGETDPYDPDSGRLLQTLLWMRSNEQQWGLYEFNLSKFASATEDVWVKIQAGSYNDGIGGVTSMYVDDVVLELCDAGAAPIEPTPPTIPAGCSNAFLNSDFELVDCRLEHPGDRILSALLLGCRIKRQPIHAHRHCRYRQEYLQLLGWLAACLYPRRRNQRNPEHEHLPRKLASIGRKSNCRSAAARRASGRGYVWEAALASDMQYVLLLDQYGTILKTLWWERWNYTTWMPLSFDLSEYAGEYVRIQFGTYNDGYEGITAMYVDDTFLDICTGTTPTPTPTPGPTPVPQPTPVPGTCNEGFANTGFETDDGWDIPITVFSAGSIHGSPPTPACARCATASRTM